MASLIDELIEHALDPEVSITDLLRKVKVVAAKLRLKDLAEWADLELNGYGSVAAAPQYRAVAGAAKWFNKIYGWMPVVFDSASLEVQCTHSKMSQSAGEIEVLVRKAKEGQPIRANASPNLQREVSNGLGMPVEVAIFFDEAQIAGVAERIRNKILDTALALEAEGIVGVTRKAVSGPTGVVSFRA